MTESSCPRAPAPAPRDAFFSAPRDQRARLGELGARAAVQAVLVRWQAGAPIRAIARETRLDRKTVRRYLAIAQAMRLEPRLATIDDEVVRAVAAVARRGLGRHRVTETQHELALRREGIRRCLATRMTLTRIHALLAADGVRVSYASLRRFAIAELGWRARPTRALAA